MSVAQIVENIKEMSIAEIEELQDVLEKERLIQRGKLAAKRWAGKTFELRSPPLPTVPAHPFQVALENQKI
jgi:ribosomal protein L7/L12